MHKRVIASASHYLLYVTGLHMHWPTCTARSSTSYQLPAASNQQTSAWHTVHVDYVFAAQPVLPIRHHMISLSGLSLVILVISSIFAMAKMRRRYERHSNEFPGDFFSWRGAVPPHQGYSIQGRARVLLLTEYAADYPKWHQILSSIGWLVSNMSSLSLLISDAIINSQVTTSNR